MSYMGTCVEGEELPWAFPWYKLQFPHFWLLMGVGSDKG